MADDSELDWIRDFFEKVLTTTTCKHVNEAEQGIDDLIVYTTATKKVWIGHGELVKIDDGVGIYEKLHIVQLEDSTELLLHTQLRAISVGINKLNHREAITSYTRESTLVSMRLRLGNKASNELAGATPNKFKMNLQLIVRWSVA